MIVRRTLTVGVAVLLGCGGRIASSSTQPNDAAAGNPPDGGPMLNLDDSGQTGPGMDSGLPPTNSAACNRTDQQCVLCDDDEYHCGAFGSFPPCPAQAVAGAQCKQTDVSDCITCWAAEQLHCSLVNGTTGDWHLARNITCAAQ